jgi:hypothetical protein
LPLDNCDCGYCRALRAEVEPWGPIPLSEEQRILRGIDLPGRIIDDVDPRSRRWPGVF